MLNGPSLVFKGDAESLLEDLKNTLLPGLIISYAQCFFLLSAASEAMKYNLDNGRIAAVSMYYPVNPSG